MVDTLGFANSAPLTTTVVFNGKQARQLNDVGFAGATSARPLGARTGVRPGTPASTVTATSTVWTCQAFGGLADVMVASAAGGYPFAFDAVATGSITPNDPSLPRHDIIVTTVTDPENGSTTPTVTRAYVAGTTNVSGTLEATVPAQSFVVAILNMPAVSGAPSVSWVAPYCAAAGGVVPFNTLAQLNLWTTAPQDQYADVFADPTTANNGLYRWNGTAWVLVVGDTGWITPTLGNSWVTAGGLTPQYRRLNGVMYMRGRVQSGTTSTVFTLPAGFRPTYAEVFIVLDGATTSTADRVVVNTDGTVTLVSGQTPNFNQVIFPADA